MYLEKSRLRQTPVDRYPSVLALASPSQRCQLTTCRLFRCVGCSYLHDDGVEQQIRQ